jgi:NADPH2:quinone reductase
MSRWRNFLRHDPSPSGKLALKQVLAIWLAALMSKFRLIMSKEVTMPNVIRIYETGGPAVMRWEDHDPGSPGPGEVRLHQEAVGLNYIDVYHRTGLYPLPALPAVLGLEGAGVVESVGDGVADFKAGDRVAYAGIPPGAYAQARCIPSHRLVPLPDSISTRQAAGMMLRGMTARYLLHGCFPVKAGDRILIHAAAGGVGAIVCQWARYLGAEVIGTVGSPEKAQIAKTNGCHHAILYREDDFADRVSHITGGKGVDVVYDSVGQATFMKSLDCLRPMGTMVSFGQASGAVPALELGVLAAKGSLFLTRPSLMTYTARRKDLLAHARDLFDVVEKGAVIVSIGQTYALADAGRAHQDLEGRQTVGSTVLIP